ncbi:MAG: carbon monoxide dehydrogenase subunit G [Chloroflexota bacterium]|nr:carbon monoxide dehydrogenase subunit G [Chloroflexota bacterium]MDE2853435.1 carbon monoxide dehydrogenase subunit G [Chloroflexota bacterium]MDE2947710.1 carbon monoxide dehydrogenase subunit G [Chloroflexota bacterium]
MHIEGTYDFDFKRELVWDVLMDIDVLGSIIPGSKGLEEIGENKYESKLSVRVGPVNGKFEAQFELADVDAPESYRLIVSGKGPAGHVTGEGTIRLEQDNGKTVMHYAGDARIGGKIAAVGQRLLDVAAKQIAKQSLKKLSKQVELRLETAG